MAWRLNAWGVRTWGCNAWGMRTCSHLQDPRYFFLELRNSQATLKEIPQKINMGILHTAWEQGCRGACVHACRGSKVHVCMVSGVQPQGKTLNTSIIRTATIITPTEYSLHTKLWRTQNGLAWQCVRPAHLDLASRSVKIRLR